MDIYHINQNEKRIANLASAAINKWLKLRVPIGCVMHFFRHSPETDEEPFNIH